ncbi:MAG: hypothetical protein M3P42_01895 [Actinomycetota bacterium]|nr:hypothetical protein [Actinomycetota bacterium]
MIWWFFYPYGVGILIVPIGTTAYGMTVALPGEQLHSGRSGEGPNRMLRPRSSATT